MNKLQITKWWKKSLKNSYTMHNSIEKGMINFGEIISAVIEMLVIQSSLDEQDEKDRKSVSLWGVNQQFPHKTEDFSKSVWNIRNSNNKEKYKLSNILSSKKNYNVVTIDKNWYSWTNPNSITLNAFKMAWLSYFPSEVKYNTQYFKRAELHDKKLYIIKNLKNQLSWLYPWIGTNVDSLKYINILNEKDLQTFEIDQDFSINKINKSILTHSPTIRNNINMESPKETENNAIYKYAPKTK